MGERIHERRKARNLTLEYVGNFVGVAKSTVRKWENGDIENISALRLQKLAVVLGTTVDYLMDGVTSNLLYKNVEAMPDVRPVPVIGKIACGEPILAKQNIEGYAELDRRVRADFALRCVGDSMINAHIFDGDLVFIKEQPDVDNGEIAAVVIDDEATLKRVYKYPNRLELRPENPLFPVLQYEGDELSQVRIIGKAIAFLGQVR
jgi:repressor LexA